MGKNPIIGSHDGSNTLFSDRFGVTYHSKFGAVDESITVFLSAGLQYQLMRGLQKIEVFEMGFGTGLNAFLTLMESRRNPRVKINYTGIEMYPIHIDEASLLSYPEFLNAEEISEKFIFMHESAFGDWHQIYDNFIFRKINSSLLTVNLNEKYDVIYYDAFAPSAQEDLWTPEVMKKMYAHTNHDGVLVTYCAKGSFKRALKSAGYRVEALPGPSGKREMTRAIKD